MIVLEDIMEIKINRLWEKILLDTGGREKRTEKKCSGISTAKNGLNKAGKGIM